MVKVDILDKNSIQDALKKYKFDIDSFGVESLHIFGSVARNDANFSSDLDVLVKFKPGKKNYDNFMNLTFLLEDVFSVKVDLITIESINGSFKESVEEESILIEI
ncbi:nucleotidyltransferase family protein [Leptospira sp. GIMC2001]|uniref:nucleotidyltransferase family protein n=1 Tax=Leptospira sp. GIMC2001 TaxID=1513297 RepID=UPI00234B0BC9|nr:nucleotidyltransferase domain-containing protein [Leptospira sp. GIMC2001]WCL51324.1 nucleotidyltransferase domain-containing protein [Leptospira sp. GIMC2001]